MAGKRGYSSGRSPRVTSTVVSWPARLKVRVTVSPGCEARTAAPRSVKLWIGRPSYPVIRSPTLRSDWPAGESATMPVIRAPTGPVVGSVPVTPRKAVRISSPAMRRSATETAVSMGMAKPTPSLPPTTSRWRR